jgi:hypothetical protein
MMLRIECRRRIQDRFVVDLRNRFHIRKLSTANGDFVTLRWFLVAQAYPPGFRILEHTPPGPSRIRTCDQGIMSPLL